MAKRSFPLDNVPSETDHRDTKPKCVDLEELRHDYSSLMSMLAKDIVVSCIDPRLKSRIVGDKFTLTEVYFLHGYALPCVRNKNGELFQLWVDCKDVWIEPLIDPVLRLKDKNGNLFDDGWTLDSKLWTESATAKLQKKALIPKTIAFEYPTCAVIDHSDNIVIGDQDAKCLHVFSLDGTFLRTIDHIQAGALCVDNEGNYIVSTCLSSANRMILLAPDGTVLRIISDSSVGCYMFMNIVVQSNGTIVAIDASQHLNFIAPDGKLLNRLCLAGDAGKECLITLDTDDKIIVSHIGDGEIEVFSPQGVHIRTNRFPQSAAFWSNHEAIVGPAGELVVLDRIYAKLFVFSTH